MDWNIQVRNDHSHQTSTEVYKPEFLAVNKRLTEFCHRWAIWIIHKYYCYAVVIAKISSADVLAVATEIGKTKGLLVEDPDKTPRCCT